MKVAFKELRRSNIKTAISTISDMAVFYLILLFTVQFIENFLRKRD